MPTYIFEAIDAATGKFLWQQPVDTPEGTAAEPPEILDPLPYGAAFNPAYHWPEIRARFEPAPHNDPARAPLRRYEQARVMGGGSSINGQQANRGTPDDYAGKDLNGKIVVTEGSAGSVHQTACLDKGALVFDPNPFRATTLFGRFTDANTSWYASKPAWQALNDCGIDLERANRDAIGVILGGARDTRVVGTPQLGENNAAIAAATARPMRPNPTTPIVRSSSSTSGKSQ